METMENIDFQLPLACEPAINYMMGKNYKNEIYHGYQKVSYFQGLIFKIHVRFPRCMFSSLSCDASTHDHCHISFRKLKASNSKQKFLGCFSAGWLPSLKLTFSPPKIGHPKRKQSYSSNPFLGAFAVSFREGNCWFGSWWFGFRKDPRK